MLPSDGLVFNQLNTLFEEGAISSQEDLDIIFDIITNQGVKAVDVLV